MSKILDDKLGSAFITFFFFYASYDHDSTCVTKPWCCRSTQILCNARRIKVIGCLEKKERNENEARLNCADFMDFRIFRAFLNFLQLFLRSKVSTQAPLKFFLWLQKHCSKHLGASTTSGLYNARRIKVIGCLEKKERNENSDVRKFHSQQRIRAVLTQTSLNSMFL